MAELLGVLLITIGLFSLYYALVGRGVVMLTIAWVFEAVLTAGTRVIEFALGVIAFPDLVSSFGGGLSPAQLAALIEGYHAIGAPVSIRSRSGRRSMRCRFRVTPGRRTRSSLNSPISPRRPGPIRLTSPMARPGHSLSCRRPVRVTPHSRLSLKTIVRIRIRSRSTGRRIVVRVVPADYRLSSCSVSHSIGHNSITR